MRTRYGANLIGRKFGRLTILDLGGKKGFATCRCDCGSKITARIHNLMTGNTTSCGCARIDNGKETASVNFQSAYDEMRKYGTNFYSIASNKPRKDNTSGVKGVTFNGKRWVARLTVQRTSYFLGSFEDMESAVAARKAGEERYFHPLIAMKMSEVQKA